MTLYDAHVTGAGYLTSPKDGTLGDLQDRIAGLLASAGVSGVRRLGCPGELRGASEAMDALAGAWSLPVMDGRFEGARAVRRCVRPADGERGVRASVAEGAGWVLLGGRLDPAVAVATAAEARRAGLRVAAEAAVLDDALLSSGHVDTVEGLVGILAGPASRDRAPWEQVASLAGGNAWSRRVRSLVEAGVTIVPLLLRSRRTSLIEEAVRAPGLEDLARILPHHGYLLQMQNPGGVRFARRHVLAHLGMSVLDRAERRAFSHGWDQVLVALRTLVEAGVVLAGGSGAPGLGLCPGVALREEQSLWLGAGLDETVVHEAFGEGGRQRCDQARVAAEPQFGGRA